jgi:light-harvesting complex II chlorophyll a/b binding protein 1/light-harvesting complex II chlorophyll a/b binding protein 2
MATAIACASTALTGQSLLRQGNELASNVNLGEARVTMRKSASKSSASGSIWSVLCTWIAFSLFPVVSSLFNG